MQLIDTPQLPSVSSFTIIFCIYSFCNVNFFTEILTLLFSIRIGGWCADVQPGGRGSAGPALHQRSPAPLFALPLPHPAHQPGLRQYTDRWVH